MCIFVDLEMCIHCVRSKEEVRERSRAVAGVLALTGIVKSPRMLMGISEERKLGSQVNYILLEKETHTSHF